MPQGDWLLKAKQWVHRSRRAQILLMMIADAAVVVTAVVLAYFARFEGSVPEVFGRYLWAYMAVAVVVFLGMLWVNGLYHMVLRHVGIHAMTRLTWAVGLAIVVLFALDVALSPIEGTRLVPFGVVFITGVIAFVGLGALRSVGRLWVVINQAGSRGGTRVLIVGAGDAGSLLLRDIENQPDLGMHVVGFLDDDPAKRGMTIRAARILGPTSALEEVVAEYGVDEIFVAIPSLSPVRKREVLDLCTSAGVKTRIIPGLTADAQFTGLADLRQVSVDDLLGREPVEIDVELISSTLTGKVVAVTGAAGSIGSELCRQIVKMRPERLLLIEIDESRLYEMYLEIEAAHPGVAHMRLCDVRDERKVDRVFAEASPDVVFHAAAYKHVPLMEAEPAEAVRANVIGTMNVLKACAHHEVEHFVLISTDKAVEPRNVMGATKAVAERVMLEAARNGVSATAVRFGNVLGSRGSVVPIFEEQLRRGGPVRVTHPEVTRYFMTIPEAARLVLQAQAMSEGGDIFVLEMGEPIKIVELARRMIVLSGVSTTVEFTGLRPGEKLHEILVHPDGDLLPTECPAVVRLSCLPRVNGEFSSRIAMLVREARIGDDAGLLVPLLCELAAASIGEPVEGCEVGE